MAGKDLLKTGMPLFLLFLLLLPACTSLTSPQALLDEADQLLSAGGLADPRTRGRMKSLYDEALRRLKTSTEFPAEERRALETRAHFGLAMNRLWDLMDRLVVVLEEGGILRLLREGVVREERPAFCPFLENIEGFERIFNLLVDTALKPIVEDFRFVSEGDPGFRIRIRNTVYPLSAFTLDRIGPNELALDGVYGQAEASLLAGVLELLTASFKAAVAYEGFLNNVVLFLLVQRNIRLKQVAKWFNSNPCVDYPQDGNPLLNPSFGVLRREGKERMEEARTLFAEGFRYLRRALDQSFADRNRPEMEERLLNGADPGKPWGTGLALVPGEVSRERFQLAFPSDLDPPMKALVELFRLLRFFLENLTPQIPMEQASRALSSIEASFSSGSLWNVRATARLLIPQGDIARLIQLFSRRAVQGIPPLEELETPWVGLGELFRNPPGDLKALAPLFYLTDEPYTDANGNGRRDPAQGVRLVEKEEYLSTEEFQDLNCNGRWDERGDLMVAQESFPFVDRNGNGSRDPGEEGIRLGGANGPLPREVGLWGMFLDLNADGFPDRPFVDGLKGSGSSAPRCAGSAPPGVSWPAGQGDPEFASGKLILGSPTPDAPYGIPITTALSAGETEDGSALGPVVGHYYPPRNWEFSSWPQNALRDPANGVTDENYFFFPDPTFQRILLRDLQDHPNESGTTNAWLNRLLTQWSQIFRSFFQ